MIAQVIQVLVGYGVWAAISGMVARHVWLAVKSGREGAEVAARGGVPIRPGAQLPGRKLRRRRAILAAEGVEG